MVLPRLTACQLIQIWRPRYHDQVVLIAKFRVGTHNEIVFTKTKSMPGSYYLSGDTIRKYPLENNGKITCYAVHIDELQVLERE